MPVFRIERTHDYTVMSNHHLKNQQLSLKAKGLLSMMLSFPDDWNYSERGLAAICKEGVDAIHSAIKELEKAGYMERHQLRGKGGRIIDTEYVIYEKPHVSDAAPPGEINTQIVKMNKTNTQVSSTQSFSPPTPLQEKGGRTDGSEQLFEIRERIDYEILCQRYRREQVDELVELMLEVQMTRGQTIRLSQNNEFPTAYVQGRFSKITYEHLEKVLDGINENTTAVKNTRAYLLSALFNSVSTLDNHYTMLVNHDFYGSQ